MAIDFLAPFGEDMALGAGSDVSILGQVGADFSFIDSRAELIQRIIRRLLTTPGEWLPFPRYGAGLRRYVNEPLTSSIAFQIKADCLAQIVEEPDVVTLPAPQVNLQRIPDGIVVTIQLFTQALQPVSFSFNPNSPDVFTNVNSVFSGVTPLG